MHKNTIVELNHSLLLESENLKHKHQDYHFIKNYLIALYKNTKRSNSNLKYFPDWVPLKYETLEQIYWCVVKQKKSNLPQLKKSYPTYFEKSFAHTLKKISKLKTYQSFWIEGNCFDLFIPRLMLIIEVDGGIHNNELKMKKDNWAEDKVKENYKIITARINNSDQHRFSHTIYSLAKESKRISSGRIKNTMAKIFIDTIANDCDLHEVQDYLNSYTCHTPGKYINHLNDNGRK